MKRRSRTEKCIAGAYRLPNGSINYRTNGLQGGFGFEGGFLEVEIKTRNGATRLDVIADKQTIETVDSISLFFRGDDGQMLAVELFQFLARQLGPSEPEMFFGEGDCPKGSYLDRMRS